MKVYVTAIIPKEYLNFAEKILEPFLLGPGINFTVPICKQDEDEISFLGCCAGGLEDNSIFVKSIPEFSANIPESKYQIIKPFRDFDRQLNWVEWLQSLGLKEKTVTLETI